MPEEIFEIPKHELVEIIDSCLQVVATLSEIETNTYDEEAEDKNTVKRNTYRIIFAAQRKLLKTIKEQ
jgi:hypothetical protein